MTCYCSLKIQLDAGERNIQISDATMPQYQGAISNSFDRTNHDLGQDRAGSIELPSSSVFSLRVKFSERKHRHLEILSIMGLKLGDFSSLLIVSHSNNDGAKKSLEADSLSRGVCCRE